MTNPLSSAHLHEAGVRDHAGGRAGRREARALQGLHDRRPSTADFLRQFGDPCTVPSGLAAALLLTGNAWSHETVIAALLGSIAYRGFAVLHRLYQPARAYRAELARTLLTWGAASLVVVVGADVVLGEEAFPPPVPALWFGATAALLALWRGLLRSLQAWYRRSARAEHRVAIVGLTHIAGRLVEALSSDGLSDPSAELSFFDDRRHGRRQGEPDPLPPVGKLCGDLGQLLREVRAGRFDEVFIALPLQASARIRAIAEALSDSTAKVSVVADFLVFDLQHAHWGHVGELSSVDLLDTPFHGVDGWLKRAEDLALGAALLAVSAVPMLVIAAAIKATSPGPVLFRQRRYGLGGKVIWVLKFRTMQVAAPDAPVRQATANDPRVTRLGAFLRRSSLDELPHFLQVLTGEMSVVGPRPHAVEHNELYRSRIQGYMQRHKVKPGITGWAQVNGWRGETDTLEKMERRIAHDLDYIDDWGVLWDLEIVARTALVVLKRTNAF